MKNSFFQKNYFLSQNRIVAGLLFFFFLQSFVVLGQNQVGFTPRFDKSIKGDMLLIGNNILSKHKTNDFNTGGTQNNSIDMVNVDIDSDNSTFNSSSAELKVPSQTACYKVVYAGLYWSAVVKGSDPITSIKFKVPGGSYVDITPTSANVKSNLIYSKNASNNDNSNPYACYADVTSYVTALTNPQGYYTVANVSSLTGPKPNSEGLSAGWSLFVVYEDPNLPAKYITSFDGFSTINSSNNLTIPVSGFKTIPVGPVRAKYAFSAIEGDNNITGDYLQINGSTISATNNAGTSIRPTNNFFNSSVSFIDTATNTPELFTTRVPKSSNTLGFDAGILNIPNPSGTGTNEAGGRVIKNGATSANIKLGSTSDVYYFYFNAFAVDIIEPKIVLTKIVKNTAGVDIGNQNVTLGQQLNYEVGFKNTGNDNAIGLDPDPLKPGKTLMTIRDQLPINIVFNYPGDLNPLPAGVTVKSYNSVTRNIIFHISEDVVKVGDPLKTISFKVKVVPDCNSLSVACSNSIDNSAYATYKGKENTTFVISDDPSVNTNTGCILTPKATNFLVGIDDCNFTKSEILCGNSVTISASNGYDSYKWSDKPFVKGVTSGTILGNSQTLTVTNPGTYYVYNTAVAPCLSITEVVTVTRFGSVMANPVIPFADEVVTCVSGGAGKQLPNIFLCGSNATKAINTNISDGSTIVWEKLDVNGSCAAVIDKNCANESPSCTWVSAGPNGPNFTVDKNNTSGAFTQFRLTLNYPGGCFNRFYFNVYHNLLTPTETHNDIICNTLGKITIGGVGTGYEYSIDGTNYQASNIFDNITTPALYTVYVRQIGVINPCIFTVPNIQIRKRDFTVTPTITQPLCNGDKGTIRVAANDANPQYNFSIYQGATLVTAVGPITPNDYTFSNLSPGDYTVKVTTQDGCSYSEDVKIIEPLKLTATSALTIPLTSCSNGEITVTPIGGTTPYNYYVNGSTDFQGVANVEVLTAGLYTINVIDYNNCETTTSINVTQNPKPVYTVTSKNNNCYGVKAGEINFDVTNANGYTLSYSIDGVNFQSSSSFLNLAAGTYTPVLKYTLSGAECLDTNPDVNLTAPASALTASGGVSELAGCGPAGEGKVRITNPQGGTPFPAPNYYLYSFDNQVSWVTTNEAYKIPGNYTLYIKDALGCIFSMPNIIIDPKPATPSINPPAPVINCDGTANSTVTVTNPNNISFTYNYYLDGTLNPNTVDPKTFLNIPSGSHTITVEYKLQSVSTYSNLLKEDFGSGLPTTTSGIASAYCFNDLRVNAPYLCGTRSVEDNQYSVTNDFWRSDDPTGNNSGAWYHFKDHTTNGVDTNGRFLLVNIGSAAGPYGVLYSKPIVDVIPNQPVKVDLYLANLIRSSITAAVPDFIIELVDASGTVVASQATGPIANNEIWNLKSLSLTPTGTNTNLIFKIRSGSILYSGNDAVIDDVQVYQLPKICITKVDFPFVVPSGQAFAASITGHSDQTCAGLNDGTITIAAQNFAAAGFYYSLDGATPVLQTSSPFTISNLSAGSHSVDIKYDLSASSCLFTLPQTISSPAAVTLSASVTKQATCSIGASITAVGGGGTQAYQYELRAADGVTVIPGFSFSTNAVFTNVAAGNYKVFVRDANLCTASTSGVSVNVTASPALTATLDSSSDLCYDTVNKAKLVVNVSGGTSPFTYSLDGATAINTNTFSDVALGTHTILVTDSNNCTATISGIVIPTQLQLNATLTQDLTCLADATINTTVTGGYGVPYTYTVSRNGGTPTTVTSFPYSATLAGTYVFTVTDSKSCPATSNAIIVSPKTTPTLTFAKTDITCNNANDGTITITASNGFTSAYTYAIKLSSVATYTTQTTNLFTGLASGTYNVKVIDSKGCESAVTDVIIVNPAVVTATISATDLGCSPTGTVPSVVTVTPSGGTGPYEYSFIGTTNFTPSNTYSTTGAGTVNAYVKDSNGCQSGPFSVVINSKVSITGINVMFDTGLECPDYEAHVKFQAIGGISPIRYQIITGPAGFSSAVVSDGEFKDLKPGNYIFRATDKNGCSFDLNYNVKNAPDIVAGGLILTPIKCFGDKGTIQFTVNGVKDRGYDYVIRNAANVIIQSATNVSETITTINVTNPQPAEVYTITATDRKTTCTVTFSITLTQPTAALAIASAVGTNINCNYDNSQITIATTGGTPNYSYAVVKALATAPTVFVPGNILTVDTNSGVDLSWDVYVKDANGCLEKRNVVIAGEVGPTINPQTPPCYAGTAIAVTITGTSVGTTTYSKDGTNFQASPTFSLTPGNYTLTIKDGFGCVASIPYVLAPQLTITATPVVDVTCTPNTTINLATNGGVGTYIYAVSSNGGATYTTTTSPYVTATAGTYRFRVTDSAVPACTAFSTDIIVTTKATVLTLSTTKVDVKCKGDATGSITITPTSGKAPFTFSVTKGGSPISTTAVTPGLTAGTYNVVITDALGCTSASTAVIIAEPAVALSATAAAPATTTCNTATTVTVTGHDGTAPYTYSFQGGAFTSTATYVVNDNGVSDQVIAYQVKDANGCITVSQNITVKKLNPPTGITFTGLTPITCNATTTNITLTPVAGVAPFTYTIVSGTTINTSGATSGIFTGLLPGNYIFEVTDANGCKKQDSKTINPAATITAAGAKTDVKCFSGTDGTATFTVTGASSVGNFTYTLTPAVPLTQITKTGNVVVVTGLGVNTYTFTATDISTGCSSNAVSQIISAPSQITFTLDATKVNCNATKSTISFPTLSGGTPGYTYAYAASPSTVPSTVYGILTTVDTAVLTKNIDVYVKDINGCFEKRSIVIGSEVGPTINPQTPPCYTGIAIAVTITGTAVGTTTYSKDGTNFQASPTFSLTPGNYTLTIKDGFGCVASIPYVLAPQLTITATPVVDITCTPDTTINLAANGGVGTYTYAVSSNGGATYTTTTSPYVTAIAGTYRFRVTDSAVPACTAFSTDIIVTTKATVLTLSTTKVDVKCKGDATGSITITPTSGKAPFTFSVTKGGSPISTTAVTPGLTAGTYNVVVTDALGCTSASTAVIIAEPAVALSATAAAPATTTCSTATTVTVTGHDGTAPYTYSFNGGAFTSTATYVVNDNGVSDQVIAYQVKDVNGCITVSQNITVKKLNPPTGITFTGLTPITCNATTTSITLTPVAGVAPFTYKIIAPVSAVGNVTGDGNGIYTGLLPGNYIFEVTDANGCSKQDSKTIAPVAPIIATASKFSDVACFGDTTGSIGYNISGFASTYSYKVNAGTAVTGQTASTFTLSGLSAGTYAVAFTDETTLCTASTSITITGPASVVSASLAGNVHANCVTPYAVVTINATGGTPNYKYAFVPNGATPVSSDYVTSNIANLDPTIATDWDVWVMDSKGCTITSPIDVPIVMDPKPTVTASVIGQCTVSGSNFKIVALGASGVAPYTYTINTGVAPSPADTFTVAPGTYTVTVTDKNGCTGTTTVTVNQVLNATAVLTKDLDCTASPDGLINVTLIGGKGPFTYKTSIDGAPYSVVVPVTGNSFTYTAPTALIAHTYQFEITDANSCIKVSNVITVNPIVYPVITTLTLKQDIKCNGDATGIIEVTIDSSKGIGPFTYSKNGVTYQSSNTFTGLTAGTYTITVKDSKGCINIVPATITITQNAPIAVTHHEIPITCGAGGVSKGSVIIDSVIGGVGPYNYFVTGANGYSASELNASGSTSVTFNVVDFGLYQINVVDANGCSKLIQNILVASPPNDLSIVINASATCGTGGKADINLAGSLTGSGPFFFAIYTGPGMVYPTGTWLSEDATGSKHAQFTNLIPGVTYTFVVYDSVSKCYYFETAAAPIPTSSTLAISNVVPKNITCTGNTDGKVSFDITNPYGVATPIIYQLYDAFTLAPKGAAVSVTIPTGITSITNFGALAVGNYFVLIKEDVGATNVGCSVVTSNFNITQSAILLNVSASVIKNENCNNLGIINALAKDGTPGYLYQISTSATAPLQNDSSWSTASTNGTFSSVVAGSYYVHVKDAYGCVKSSPVVVLIKDPTPVIALSVIDKCADEGNFDLKVDMTTAGIPPYTIVVNGSAPQSAIFPYPTITGLSSGLQTVTIKDANGCSFTETITIAAPLVATPAITALPTCANNDGIITISGAGGTLSYSYAITAGPVTRPVQPSNIFNGLPAGTYTVTMTDTATPTNCSTTASVTLSVPTPVTFTTTTTPALCNGETTGTGSITVILGAANNNPNYSYEITAPIIRAAQSSNVFTGLLAGTYTVKVNSGRGCSLTNNTVIVAPAVALVATAAVTTKLTCGTGNIPQKAIVTVTGSGGAGTYEYSFDGVHYSSQNTYETYSSVTVTGYVKDANGCVASNPITVNTLNPPTQMDITGTPIWCSPLANTTSTVNITNIINGVSPFTYQNITSGTSNSTGSFTGLTAGDYIFQVTDANGCTYQELYTVKALKPIAIVGALANNISCNVLNGTNNNGSAKFTVTGFSATGNYTIITSPVVPAAQISTVNDVITLTGLTAGIYTVTVTDNTTGCSKSDSVTLTAPVAITFSTTASHVFCSQDVSQITVSSVAGGTGVYTYAAVLAGASAPTTYDSNPVISVDTDLNALKLSWDVYVKDANGCISVKVTTPVVLDAAPTISLPTAQCFTGTPLTVNLSGLTSTYNGAKSYTVNGFAIGSSTATFNGPGTYILGIKDDHGCEAFVNYKIEKQLLATATLIKDLYCAAPVNASIEVLIQDGVAPYSYQMYSGVTPVGSLVAGVAGPTFTASVSAIGTYHFVITDSNGATCSVTTNTVTVTTPTTPTFSTSKINVSCAGGNDGSITVNPVNGFVPYTFALSGPVVNHTGDANGIYTGLTAGSYTIVVTDAKGCASVAAPAIVITAPVVLTATASVSANTTCSITRVITVVGHDGTQTGTGTGYYYSFDNGLTYDTVNTFTVNDNGSIQTIKYSVKDANGCSTVPQNIIVNPLNPPTQMDITGTAIWCSPLANTTSTVNITNIINGVGPFTYQNITSGTSNSTGSFTGLTAGDYIFQVTDANGCTYQELYTVKALTPIAIVGVLANNISCNVLNGTNNNGSAKFTVTGFSATGNYTIITSPVVPAAQISTVNDVITLTGLTAGIYTVTVTDNTTGCSKSDSVTLTAPVAITFSTTASHVFCSQDVSQITVSSVAGGTGVYTYAAVLAGASAPTTYDSNPVISVDTDLNALKLSWDVYVKDANGCISVKVTTPVVLDAAPTISLPTAQCFTGTPLTVNLSGLTSTYNGAKSYTVNGFAIGSSTATFNGPGTYILGIKDDHGCEAFVNYKIEKQLLATATLIKDLYCAAPVNASIEVSIQDGVAPYSYQMYSGVTPVGSLVTGVAGPTFTASVSAIGTYHFVITDSNGATCSVTTNTVTVTTPATPTFTTTTPVNVSCKLGNDGSFIVIPTNGIAPYTFALSGPVVNHTGDANGIYTGLTAGSYTIVVTDAKGCTSVAAPAIVITEPVVLTATASVTPFGCDTANTHRDAIVTITAVDGTAPYSYSFNGGGTFQVSNSFTVSSPQTINYVVHDANGCIASGSAIIVPYTPPTDMNLTASPVYCNTPVATVTVNSVTGGVMPYTYEIISPTTAVTAPSATNSFANLAPDTYSIKVTDANGCSFIKAIIVSEASKIEVTAQLMSNVLCNGGNTGAIAFRVFNYITAGSYNFSLTPPTGTFTQNGDIISYTGLTAGNYTFTVTDNVSGCVDNVVNFMVSQPVVLSSTSVATNINCNNDNATITVAGSGGTGPYKYAVARATDPVPTIFILNNQLAIDTNNGADTSWIVYVKDANGCSTSNAQTIILDTNPTIGTAIATQCPSATGTYDITVTATGFSSALQYSLDGVSFQTSNIITVNAPGNYNVTVKDANGCLSVATPVTILQPLSLSASITKVPTCNAADGEVTLVATGGTIPSSYEYSKDGLTYVASNVFTGLAPNVIPYKFYVRDLGTNCVQSIDFTIEPATLVTGLTLIPTHVTCNLGNNGVITATLDTPAAGINDNPVYMYSLNGGTPQISNVFTGLIAGTYTVKVISGKGCEATASTTVNEPAVITVPTPTPVQFACNSGSNTMNFATITVAGVIGGSGNYTIYEFIKNGNAVPVQKGTSNVYTEANLLGGSYTVNVYDDKGCVGSTATAFTINPYITLDKVNVTVNNAITCTNLEDVTVSASSIGGTPTNLEFTLVDVNATTGIQGGLYPSQTNTTGVFTGLLVGNYLVTVKNIDTGCSIQGVHYVNEPNTFELKVNKTSDVVCYGSNEGTVELTIVDNQLVPSNDAGIFDYVITSTVLATPITGTSTSAGPWTVSGLRTGSYTVTATLTNSPKCAVTTSFTIDQSTAALAFAETHTMITCATGDGTISVTATGGWLGDYQFEVLKNGLPFSVYSAQTNYTNLSNGIYRVNVKDTHGCIAFIDVALNNPTPITVTAIPSTLMVSCKDDKSASITATGVSGGQGSNYSYKLNYESMSPVVTSGPQSSPIFTGLGAGKYSITVTDGWSCSSTSLPVTINEPTKVEASLVLATLQTCLVQSTLTLSATGGTGSYTYSADPSFASPIAMIGNTATFSVPNGTFHYYVKDANGCVSIVSNDIQNDPLEPLAIDLDIVNSVINCKGDLTGVVVAKAKGGLGGYTYTLLDSTHNPIASAVQNSAGNFTSIAAGIYYVRVNSGIDCNTVSGPIVITEPNTALSAIESHVDVVCNGNNDGKITISANGTGTGIVKYAISPNLNKFFDNGVFENLAPGKYEIVVQDQNGCYIYYSIAAGTAIEIKQPAVITSSVVPGSEVQEFCAGDKTGAFDITIAGGVAPYSTTLDDPNGIYVQDQVKFSGLSGGEHIVYIKDANTCTFEVVVGLKPSVTLNPTATITYDCVNNSAANSITVAIDASNSPADVEYSLDNSSSTQPSNVFTNLVPGDHFIMVHHKNGCVDATPVFHVNKVDPLAMSLDIVGLNEIVATTTGGSGVYHYSVNGEDIGTNNKYIYFKSGDYTFTVTDTNGCSLSVTKYFEFIDIIIPPIFTPTGDGINDTWQPTNTENYPGIKFVVYDRYGREVGVFGAGQSWDGKYNGTELPMGDYWYVLKLRHTQDDREFIGHFTLYR
ncbi:T9SS type B sorting domain-containing protein [Flavobacterium sp. WC2509]|uniref:T9SS type B sorting domain-containing protein n=1 Tax=Flavobacterium sp. WC2509 TaxID=3461406 RepID=UPI0040448747